MHSHYCTYAYLCAIMWLCLGVAAHRNQDGQLISRLQTKCSTKRRTTQRQTDVWRWSCAEIATGPMLVAPPPWFASTSGRVLDTGKPFDVGRL